MDTANLLTNKVNGGFHHQVGMPVVKPNGHARADGSTQSSQQEPVPIAFKKLDDGSLIDLVEADDTGRTRLVRYVDGQVFYHDQLQYRETTYVPIAKPDSMRLATGVQEYGSARHIFCAVAKFIGKCVDLDGDQRALLAHFVLCTWVVDRLPTAPYVAITGLSESGKTALLSVLSLVCRRSLLTGDISPSAVYKSCDEYAPTLLIDDADDSSKSNAIHHLLRIGNTHNVVVMRPRHSYKVFGCKILVWRKIQDDASLDSRCLVIQMLRTMNSKLKSTSDPEILSEAQELQRKLLKFRFDRYDKVRVPEVTELHPLSPREKDLFQCLAAPIHDDKEICEDLKSYMNMRAIMSRKPLHPEVDAVLAVLFDRIHERAGDTFYPADIAYDVLRASELSGKIIRLTPRRVGAILSSFDITHKQRRNRGWFVVLDQKNLETLHRLVDAHGLDLSKPANLLTYSSECKICNPPLPNADEHSEGHAPSEASVPGSMAG